MAMKKGRADCMAVQTHLASEMGQYRHGERTKIAENTPCWPVLNT
jgi:hypothetical protein